MERAQRVYAEQKEQEQKESEKARQKMEEEEVRVWEKRQVGLSVVAGGEESTNKESRDAKVDKEVRMLEYEGDGRRGEVFALRRTQAESIPEPKAAGPKVASFWVPSQTPSASHPIRPPPSSSPQCTASHSHPLKLSHLTPVHFKTDTNGTKICPSCDRPFHNGTHIDALRSCGHTTCHSCTRTFVLPAKACFVCQEKVTKKDVIRVDSEGTAFAAAGGQMVASQYTSALQA
ncbi:hypothetical protein GGH96_003165 [Coemansia sp. RSA 1972]|nr:hypothetical protein GGH96_003165 [Coemansia sp. RSA 1972]